MPRATDVALTRERVNAMLILRYRAACVRRSIRHELAFRRYGMASPAWSRNIRAAIVALAEAGYY